MPDRAPASGRLRPLAAAVIVATAATLAACASLDERLAQTCRTRGVADGTAEMTDCVARERDAYEAAARQAQGPAGPAYIPPSFRGGSNGACFPSPRTGVVC